MKFNWQPCILTNTNYVKSINSNVVLQFFFSSMIQLNAMRSMLSVDRFQLPVPDFFCRFFRISKHYFFFIPPIHRLCTSNSRMVRLVLCLFYFLFFFYFHIRLSFCMCVYNCCSNVQNNFYVYWITRNSYFVPGFKTALLS